MSQRPVDVVVIGAGQAGLSAGYHLRRGGFSPVEDGTERSFVMLDDNAAPGGAWQHRWADLTMATVNDIAELPGFPAPSFSPDDASRDVLPAYFAAFEQRFDLRVRRPVGVRAVRSAGDSTTSRLVVETSDGTWTARFIVNATGTWTRPFRPFLPGQDSFAGRQLDITQYRSASDFAGIRVAVVGGGVSAINLLAELSRVAETVWFTRREPVWADTAWDQAARIETVRRIDERVRGGLPPLSVVSQTGLHWTGPAIEARDRGALERLPMFTRIEPGGVRLPDGSFERADAILWATGFRPELRHLRPLGLRTAQGGYRVARGRSLDDPRVFLLGYGPQASTIGANRAGRSAVAAILRDPVSAPVPAG